APCYSFHHMLPFNLINYISHSKPLTFPLSLSLSLSLCVCIEIWDIFLLLASLSIWKSSR
ncbi:MAG: hypothetical protein N7Q72_06745, partial [Spiroplasma sp. Tabriz.8]|nr:hypothetical protein [Spiroplasma sp. Tabriz.8]